MAQSLRISRYLAWRESHYATDRQKSFLMMLANKCFSKRIDVGYDMKQALVRMTKKEASVEIERLKTLLEKQ
jgi:hypothetical protein